MSNSLNPVFGEWYTDKQIGNGTDGKVFSIYKENYSGEREYSILKIIRLGENRSERKTFSSETVTSASEDEHYEKIIKKITDNIETVKKSNADKFIIKYEDFELRRASDGKGRLVLLRLENAKSLAEITKELSFTHEEVIRLGMNICRGLSKCRSFGYIYPNLKPENILFTQDGKCKLGDFGTFSCLEPSKTSISYKRTQYFMAPEFIKSGNINCTADTYSLGLILYMLTNRNRLPFTEPYPQKVTVNSLNEATKKRISAQQFEKPVFASDELWSIIKKACNFNPNKRYFSPDQMLSDLKNALLKKPFEEPKYEEIYSKSVETDEPDSVDITEIEGVSKTVEETTPVISIREEVQIPDVDPVYTKKKGTHIKRPHVKQDRIPEIRIPAVKANPASKKLVISAVIAAVMVVLFIISLVLHNNALEQVNGAVNVYNYLSDYLLFGGVSDLWLLI
ncbi:MAG: protein kinase [Clostridia bacterium]|nr:protein kinase [Clostridia bacterium]